MAKITFITKDQQTIITEGHSGSVMELAKQYNVKGIDGDCGGVCSCATCHVHVDPKFMHVVGKPNEIEKDMLELSDDPSPYSRLACQIDIAESLDGMILKVAR